jgi:hypothetical protein
MFFRFHIRYINANGNFRMDARLVNFKYHAA